MAEGSITIVQPYTGYKIHDIGFHQKTRSAETTTYSYSVTVKGAAEGDIGGVYYYRVLEEVLRVEHLGKPIKRSVLFRCDWFKPLRLIVHMKSTTTVNTQSMIPLLL